VMSFATEFRGRSCPPPRSATRRPRFAAAARNVILATLLAGCAAPLLYRIDTERVDRAKVEADKLACAQEAQGRLTWRELAVGIALGPLGSALYESRSQELHDKQRRIEAAGEACMVRRGYSIKTE